VCGSDQIWNPALFAQGTFDPAFFLQFGPEDVRRCSYAASFGGYQPNAAESDTIRKYLRRFQHVSVREVGGQTLLKRVLGREVELVLDPTLLIDNYNDWLCPVPQAGEYVLHYALQNSVEIQHASKTVASYYNKPIWSFGGPILPWKAVGWRQAERGPAGWLSLINGATAIVTNSFHGLVFGLLFHKRVVVVPLAGESSKRNERMFHLCDLLGVRDTVISGDVRSALSKEISWDSVAARLVEHRQSSIVFLRSALPSA
jgi:hypothetical protein